MKMYLVHTWSFELDNCLIYSFKIYLALIGALFDWLLAEVEAQVILFVPVVAQRLKADHSRCYSRTSTESWSRLPSRMRMGC